MHVNNELMYLDSTLSFEAHFTQFNDILRSCSEVLYFELDNLSGLTMCESRITKSCTSTVVARAVLRLEIVL